MPSKERYWNVPITLMRNATKGNDYFKTSLSNIIFYAIYDKYKDLEYGDDEDKMQYTLKYLGITSKDWEIALERAEKVYFSVPDKTAKFGIKSSKVFEFRDDYKTDFEVAVFCAFCAVKSILGKKSYVRISNNFLLARMAGFNSTEELEELPDSLLKYTSRRLIDKIKNSLEINWGVRRYNLRGVNGNYVSIKLSYEELFKIVENKKENNKEARVKEEKRLALLKVKEEIKLKGNVKNVHH